MASGSRTLKLSILADASNLTTGLKKAETDTESFGTKMGEVGKKVAAAFAVAAAAAAAYAVKLAVDGVKSAIEDEAAQIRLATALRNTTGATDEQIKSVEEWISKTQLAFGISDQQLRPALDRLVRSTKDVGEAQKLLSLALDISAGTGKSLDQVVQALGKAYDGNTGSLSRLGVGIDKAELKTMSFDEITGRLAQTFEGQASKQADTFQGKMARLSEAMDEAKETVGSFILDAIQPLASFAVDTLMPALSDLGTQIGEWLGPIFTRFAKWFQEDVLPAAKALWGWFTGTLIPGIRSTLGPIISGLGEAFGYVKKAIDDSGDAVKPFMEVMQALIDWVVVTLGPAIGEGLGRAFARLGFILALVMRGTYLVFGEIGREIQLLVSGTIGSINALIAAYNKIPRWLRAGGILNPSGADITPIPMPKFGSPEKGSSEAEKFAKEIEDVLDDKGFTWTGPSGTWNDPSGNGSGSGSGKKSSSKATTSEPSPLVAFANTLNDLLGAKLDDINTTLAGMSNDIQAAVANSGTSITVEGTVIDPEGAARAIQDLLDRSSFRTGQQSDWAYA